MVTREKKNPRVQAVAFRSWNAWANFNDLQKAGDGSRIRVNLFPFGHVARAHMHDIYRVVVVFGNTTELNG